jgi:hypothetical protein
MKLPALKIAEFHSIYRLYMEAANKPLVQTAARLRNDYPTSDNDWERFRSALVAAGRESYMTALRDPDSIAELGGNLKYFGNETAVNAANEAYTQLGRGDVSEAAKIAMSELLTEIEYHPAIGSYDEGWLPRSQERYDAARFALGVAEVCGEPALFTAERVDRSDVPDGLFVYEMRDGGIDGSLTLERKVRANKLFAGTVITAEPLDFGGERYICIEADNFSTANGIMTLDEFAELHAPAQGGMGMTTH